jgi:hypothetical protein
MYRSLFIIVLFLLIAGFKESLAPVEINENSGLCFDENYNSRAFLYRTIYLN